MPSSLPFATENAVGTKGKIRCCPGDFAVEEIPLYLPEGAGEHVYLKIEKTGIPTLEAVRRIANALGCATRDMGFAGMKDANAVTVQWLSVWGVDSARAERLELPGLRVIEVSRHRNKLRRGHLLGNRFAIVIRGEPSVGERARQVLRELSEQGVPNAFGPQRFGVSGNTHRLGRAVVLGDGRSFFQELLASIPDEAGGESLAAFLEGDVDGALRKLPPGRRLEETCLKGYVRSEGDLVRGLSRVDRSLKKLWVSGFQASVFNEVLRTRFQERNELLVGDLAWIHRNGAVFSVESPEEEGERLRSLEISPSGPLFGPRVTLPSGVPGELEREILEAQGVKETSSRAMFSLRGARRPLRVPLLEAATVDERSDSLLVQFALPPGAYATVVLREIMKDADVR